MTRIIGFSGRKQSGKNTAANFIYGLYMAGTGRFKDVGISNDGQIEIVKNDDSLVVFEPQKYSLGIGDIDPEIMDTMNQLAQTVKIYSFADPLKTDICMNVLGLFYDQCYGSDDNKNEITHLKWEDMPGIEHNKGYMTAREVMEWVGTALFRKMNTNCWADAIINRINRDQPKFALITDVRFPNEVLKLQTNNGIVIRLTRNPLNSSADPEVALDKDRFDWSKFDHIVDNSNMTIAEQVDALYPIILQEVTENANS